MPTFDNLAGNQTFRGTGADYDQVDYAGQLADYTFTQNANGSVTVAHPTLGTDTLHDINGFWFAGERAWYSIEQALRLQGDTGGFVDADGVINGTLGDDILTGSQGVEDIFYADRGNDIIDGGGSEYDQVELDGDLREYRFTQNDDGSVRVMHATWGDNTFIDIDGMWFIREQAWYSIEDAIAITSNLPEFTIDADGVLNGTAGNDRMEAAPEGTLFYGGTGNDRFIGIEDMYDQVNYDGDLEDYSFTRQANGTVVVTHPVWGRDVLIDIDGIWFNGKGEWYSVDDAVRGPIIVSRDVSDLYDDLDAPFDAPIEGPADVAIDVAPDLDAFADVDLFDEIDVSDFHAF